MLAAVTGTAAQVLFNGDAMNIIAVHARAAWATSQFSLKTRFERANRARAVFF
jgi:hypothetical protein